MRQYNPLSVDELGRNAAHALMEYPPDALPPLEQFTGAGVYTLHYVGSFNAYAGMGDKEPIYVGKADLPGKRRGQAAAKRTHAALYRRLSKHAESIDSAKNLNLDDFLCRWLILDSVWIELTEQVLITGYQPVWNTVVDGFGNNDPGRGRWNQRRSQWDTLHPGRRWAYNLQDLGEVTGEIITAVKQHLSRRP